MPGPMIALTFALPDESRSFVASLSDREVSREGKRLPLSLQTKD